MIKLTKTRHSPKYPYMIHYETVSGEEAGGGDSFTIKSAHTIPDGEYIGGLRMARFLAKRGITPELATLKHSVCSVGFNEDEQKWYGWSHRAICGFEVGNLLFEANWPAATDKTPFIAHGSTVIESMDQAREAAVAFARSVS